MFTGGNANLRTLKNKLGICPGSFHCTFTMTNQFSALEWRGALTHILTKALTILFLSLFVFQGLLVVTFVTIEKLIMER